MSEALFKDLQLAGAPVGVSVLCPGFVQTRIAESDRNRPAWAPERDVEGAEELRGVIQGMWTPGSAPLQWRTASSTPSAPKPSTSSRTPS